MIADALSGHDRLESFLPKLRDRLHRFGARRVRTDADEDELVALHAFGMRSDLRGAVDQFRRISSLAECAKLDEECSD